MANELMKNWTHTVHTTNIGTQVWRDMYYSSMMEGLSHFELNSLDGGILTWSKDNIETLCLNKRGTILFNGPKIAVCLSEGWVIRYSWKTAQAYFCTAKTLIRNEWNLFFNCVLLLFNLFLQIQRFDSYYEYKIPLWLDSFNYLSTILLSQHLFKQVHHVSQKYS